MSTYSTTHHHRTRVSKTKFVEIFVHRLYKITWHGKKVIHVRKNLELELHGHDGKQVIAKRRTVTIIPTFSLTNLPSLRLNHLSRF